jgi:UDP-N-acetylglucosamine:LPS N-acetylglucosamine transferase
MKKTKLLIILGEGGHSTELLNLVDLLGDKFEYNYIITKEDNISINHIRFKGPVYKLSRPRGKKSNNIEVVLKILWVALNSLIILLRSKPRAIVSTGPAISVPVSIIGKFLGKKIIFIETGSRVKNLSLTGRIMYHFADLFFIQWPQLKEKAPHAIFAGRLI